MSRQDGIGIWISGVFSDLGVDPYTQTHLELASRCIRKLGSELEELEAEPLDPTEAADMAIALFSIAYFAGYDLLGEVDKKMQKNALRRWTMNEDGTISHVKEVS